VLGVKDGVGEPVALLVDAPRNALVVGVDRAGCFIDEAVAVLVDEYAVGKDEDRGPLSAASPRI